MYMCGLGSSVRIATGYGQGGLGSNAVCNKQARRKVVCACCSVYVAKCSESNS